MMRAVVFTKAARQELFDAIDWYESRRPGLGQRFADEVGALTERMAASPQQFPVIRQNIRKAPVRSFPYRLIFRTTLDIVQVIACFHTSRSPMTWQSRLP
ncbi:type II toxin-antitoxin system RelE/ParE family toxin [Azospirillum rugosum]|uniref:Plasmid stabilization system protein ParE n=1 Tax=Azospirillum rugosum TaxID=416170 RepID=A0ABS4SPM4_9PROT|nr:type II toxin-antitoxin system RelE/ParE family toxin [Azospirillum rugosum]MBP2294506.1 plasmid stabilization system protein ParE [Azospirillum rugosum]MDQ0529011.1 plasmid stabilization system protein ParE [Azospirillum rugosum]